MEENTRGVQVPSRRVTGDPKISRAEGEKSRLNSTRPTKNRENAMVTARVKAAAAGRDRVKPPQNS